MCKALRKEGQCFITLTAKKHFQEEPPVFQFVPVAASSVTGHHRKELDSVDFGPSLQEFMCIGKFSPEPSRPPEAVTQLD